MAVIVGQIEPLKKLKQELSDKGITRFSSIGEINAFKKNYQLERQAIPENTKVKLDDEIEALTQAKDQTVEKSGRNTFFKIIYYLKIWSLTKKLAKLTNNYDKVLSDRITEAGDRLNFVRETVDGLYPVIAGAIAENKTVKEIEKLSDGYYLINDFALKFDPPMYNKRENDRIFSIQIDHLLVSKAGVFLLETKNWSNRSINDLDLRSPVKQIKRTSYALFVLLNSDSGVDVVKHHWGSAKIPIRNLIVMTNSKPNEEFRHVKVLTLEELNSYIQYFDEVFTDEEVGQIFSYLKARASV